jgi:APA family basic amino acid/polyamine antiporter
MSFVVAGLTAGVTAYAYARLGRLMPRNSPEFHYTALAFGPRVGAFAAWLMLAADILAAATVAIGFGGYLEHLAGTPTVANAFALLAAVAVVLYRGIGGSVAIAVGLTVLEAAGLLFIVGIGVPTWTTTNYLAMPRGVDGVVAAAALIFFAYLGFDELGNLAEEMRRPERDLPRALFVAMVVSTVIYVLVALSAVGLVGSEALASSNAPLALVARRALGSWADLALTAVALAATTNTVLLLLVAAPRSVYGMAVAQVLPGWLARVNRAAIPSTATAAVLGLTAAAITAGDLTRVAALTDVAVLVAFMFVNASLAWLVVTGRASSTGVVRLADGLLAALGLLLCGALVVRIHA